MPAWTEDELRRIGTAEELRITSRRADGELRSPRTIWVVRLGDDLYVRSVNGRGSTWFKGTRARHEGHIRAGGVDRDVALVDAEGDGALNDDLDAAYRSKYGSYPDEIVGSITSSTARDATLRLVAG